MVAVGVGVGSVVRMVGMRRVRTRATALALGTLEFVELVAGEHGECRHLAGAGGASGVAKLAIRIAVLCVFLGA